jgi:hypothetical protein
LGCGGTEKINCEGRKTNGVKVINTQSSFVFFGFFTLEYGTNSLSRNVGKELPLLTLQ